MSETSSSKQPRGRVATAEQIQGYRDGASAQDLASAAGVPKTVMRAMLKRAGVRLRTRGQARVLSLSQGKAWRSMPIKAAALRPPGRAAVDPVPGCRPGTPPLAVDAHAAYPCDASAGAERPGKIGAVRGVGTGESD